MFDFIPLFPEQASTGAARVDHLFFFLVAVSTLASLLIAGLLIGLGIRYRRHSGADRSNPIHHSTALELFWSAVPLVFFLVCFFWGASIFIHLSRPPDEAMEIQVLGKRWMWKLQHANGRREINELHVPVGQPVKLIMTSEDVIHSFYVPAFRIKADVLPGRYSSTWFNATRPGRYHLLCAEYCGTQHSRMIGSVVVMEPAAFQTWLAGQGAGVSMAAAGERLFESMGCVTCHNPKAGARGPDLANLFSSQVSLVNGQSVTADENYLRESILNPRARMVEGYEALMPTFQGLINEDGILQLIEYLKSISTGETTDAAPGRQAQGEGS